MRMVGDMVSTLKNRDSSVLDSPAISPYHAEG